MTKWACHQCGNINDIEDRVCTGNGKKKSNDPNAVGKGKCYHKRQPLDKIIGEEKKVEKEDD